MPSDTKPEDQVTEAGAVELDESQLESTSGGYVKIILDRRDPPPDQKASPELKIG